MKVRNVIISKQFEESNNLKSFIQIANRKHISVKIVESMNRINIENNLYFDVLFPDSKNAINNNALNNNSLVCKLIYNDFSMLFTGDIEEIAEKAILEKYKGTNILQATVLKVAHHGSKTSSTLEFLRAVSPKIALIGAGQNNNFGHPNKQIIERLQDCDIKVYRTDENGEISIDVNKRGKIVRWYLGSIF